MKVKVRIDEDGVERPVLTDDGREIPDSRPMAPPIGFVRRQPLHERIRAMVQHEYMRAKEGAEVETPEEADDFMIPGEDDMDPREGRFAVMPGYEWEDNYEPPKDFKDMRERLIKAGWTPPKQGQEAASEKREMKGDEKKPPLDAAKAADAGPGPAKGP